MRRLGRHVARMRPPLPLVAPVALEQRAVPPRPVVLLQVVVLPVLAVLPLAARRRHVP